MSVDERVQFRIDFLKNTVKPPCGTDDVDSACHGLAVALLGIGGVSQIHNAMAVLDGAMDTWERKPEPATVMRIATWLTKQDSETNGVLRRADAILAGKGTTSLQARLQDAMSGKMQSLEWPWKSFSVLTRSLMPGAITIIVGNPGTSKSFMLLQAVLHWQQSGIRTSLMELEEDTGFWLNRALAVLSGVGSCTDPAWIARFPDETRRLFADNHEQLQLLSENMTTAPPAGMTMDKLALWVEKQCQEGYRIICIDPITAASVGEGKPWLAAESFMLRVKQSIVKHGASLVITTHPRKGGNAAAKQQPDQDSIAGGAAFGRFASTILWLEGNSTNEEVTIMDQDGGEREMAINRRVRILKTREGRGSGMCLGLCFDGRTLRLSEEGIVVTNPNGHERARKTIRSMPRKKITDAQRDLDAEANAEWMTR